MDKMKEYMKALQEGKGYGWIDQNGFDMNKGDSSRTLQNRDNPFILVISTLRRK